VLLCGLVVAIVAALLALVRPALLTQLDYRVYDAMMRWSQNDQATGRVVIVDVDERSLSAIGQWPWRRDVIGRLVGRLRELGARVIALDVLFAESDRSEQSADARNVGPRKPAPGGNGLEGPDAALADALRAGGVILGYALTFGGSAGDPNTCVLHPLGIAIAQPPGEGAESPLFRASGAICSLPGLAQAAGASGFLNAVPDADGILRRVPLLMEYHDRIYPSLMLAAVVAATGTKEMAFRVTNEDAASLILDQRSVPLDGKANLLLHYRGTKNTFRSVSAGDVIRGQVAADTFRDRLVVVGATALGARDVVMTPLDALVDGVEVQATVADNLFGGDPLSRPGYALTLEMLAALGLGIAIALLSVRVGLVSGSLGVVGCGVALWGAAGWAFSVKGAFLSPLLLTLDMLAVLAAVILATFTRERGRADRAARERAVAQRLMVQTLLSVVEVRDAETGRHSRRTQLYTKLVAEQLSSNPRFRDYLTPERIDLLASLAPLHDIGKVGVPDHLLNKPGQLTGDELEEMRKHPSYGRDVILTAERQSGVHDDATLTLAKDIVYTHHEWWDGHGYPQHLQGEQIPICGRLIALVDVYDALTSTRVYRPPMSHDKAVDLIVNGRGTHFDPDVVDAFLQVAPNLKNLSVDFLGDPSDRIRSA
jgi:CHASE2 domain-containing sensor protein